MGPKAARKKTTARAAAETVARVAGQTRRLAEVAVVLPEGVTPPGTRGRILQAALTQFAEHGFHGTSIRKLAAAVGLTSASLYVHYTSKEQILDELVRIGHEELATRMRAAAEEGANPSERLESLVRAHVRMHVDFALLAVVTNIELHALAPEDAAKTTAVRAESFQLLLDAVQSGVDTGEFTVEDPLLATIAIGSIGIRVAHWFGPDQPFTPDQVADRYAGYALRIVGAGATLR
ncbi:TetR/AcrR family transcriptional regulator [Amycolatopsis saalfeldensis]|uniref:DNA-binding transcriptional regulator, AcrR family n=1 Tax=Amycolatopsis saalfeldensis TaxID=394193 RepID=A0A1H8Y8X9_9PSEU|nr:TetR/AcrR family transcriptional regulator [Amycolatopsis saalfeldensis]SEP48599.1 DNA-binding transcriptional regulator, AcrR family [Amycolatopsis saalfeldensis]